MRTTSEEAVPYCAYSWPFLAPEVLQHKSSHPFLYINEHISVVFIFFVNQGPTVHRGLEFSSSQQKAGRHMRCLLGQRIEDAEEGLAASR